MLIEWLRPFAREVAGTYSTDDSSRVRAPGAGGSDSSPGWAGPGRARNDVSNAKCVWCRRRARPRVVQNREGKEANDRIPGKRKTTGPRGPAGGAREISRGCGAATVCGAAYPGAG